MSRTKSKILYINTTYPETGFVEINSERTPVENGVLEAVDNTLRRSQTSLQELSLVKVNTGPGSFTSLRTGVAVANALNFALGLKRRVLPEYGKSPNITRQKKLEFSSRL